MGGFIVCVLMFLMISASVFCDGQHVWVGESPVMCSSEGVQCDRIGDNLIDAVTHVMTLEECRQMCLDDGNCEFISYFGDSAAPVSHLCLLFTTCETTNNCSNCVSENMVCYRSCSLGADCRNQFNVVRFLDTQVVTLSLT